MDETGSPSLLDMIRALIDSTDDREAFVDGPRAFLGDRGMTGITRADVQEAGTVLEIDLPAPDPAVTLPPPDPAVSIPELDFPGPDPAVTLPPPDPAVTLPAPPDELDGAIAEIQSLLITALPNDPIVARIAPDAPGEDSTESSEPATYFEENFGPAGEHFEEALDEMSGEEGGLTDALREVVGALEGAGNRIGEEGDEAMEDFAEGDVAAGTLGLIAGGMLAPAAEAADMGIDAVGDVAEGAISTAGEIVSGVVSVLVGVTGNEAAMEYVEEGLADFEEGFDTVAEYTGQGFDYLGDGVGYVVEGVGEVAEGVGEVIDEGIEAVGDAAEEVGDWLGL